MNKLNEATNNDFEDSISCISWSSTTETRFAVGTWDGQVKVFNVQQKNGQLILVLEYARCCKWPVTAICWHGSQNVLYLGCSNGDISELVLESDEIYQIANEKDFIVSLFLSKG